MTRRTPTEAGAAEAYGDVVAGWGQACKDLFDQAVEMMPEDLMDEEKKPRIARIVRMVDGGSEEQHVLELARSRSLGGIPVDGGIPTDEPFGSFLDPEPPPPDPDSFFDKHGLKLTDLCDAVLKAGLVGTGPGQTLWRYHPKGVWLSDGLREITNRSYGLLGQRGRKSHVSNVVDYFKSCRPIIADEPDTSFINVANGHLDWRTGQLHPHDPMKGSTWQLAVNWTPDAVCPTVDAWLAQVAPDDAIDLLWEVIGAAIYADLPVHRVVLLHGPGRNGKGTFLRLVKALVGTEHCASVTLQGLAERFAAAELFGKAVNLAGDLDARNIGRTDIFKMVTGGDMITAEHKYGQPFQFTNRALMLFAANELPGTTDHSHGYHSRFVIVPFDRKNLRPDEIDASLEPRMHAELEGVLVKGVAGLQRLKNRGAFTNPTSVHDATANYRETSDPVRRFVDEHVDITGEPTDKVTRRNVLKAYQSWCRQENHHPLGGQRFWQRVRTIDPDIDVDGPTIGGVRHVTGIVLNAAELVYDS